MLESAVNNNYHKSERYTLYIYVILNCIVTRYYIK